MEVVWSDMALTQLDEVIDYVEEHFGLLTCKPPIQRKVG